MQLQAGQIFLLTDAEKHQLGRVAVEKCEKGVIFASFSPAEAFSSVRQLFREFEEAVEAQALAVVDELDRRIAALGLKLYSPDGSRVTNIHDVQIWSDGEVTFQLHAPSAAVSGGALAQTA